MKKIISLVLISILILSSVYGEESDYVIGIYEEGKIKYEGNQSDETTLFNYGSISKLFATTLVATYVSSGELSFSDDVGLLLSNEKLKGITIHHLLTHTSGLEQSGLYTANEKINPKLHKLFEPGQVTLYSSVALNLIEDIVNTISDDGYELALYKRVLEPLDMTHTAFDSIDMPMGYSQYNTSYKASGNIVSSNEDMLKLMDYYLSDQDFLFKNSIKEKILSLQFSNGSISHGRGYGFAITSYKGHKVVYHDGGAPGTNSRFYMIPGLNFGFVLTYNSNDYDFKSEVTDRILQTYVADKETSTYSNLTPVTKYDGIYLPLDNSLSTIEKLNTLFGQINVSGGNVLSIGLRKYLYESDGVYYQEESPVGVTFKTLNSEKYMILGNTPFKKATFYETLTFQLSLLIIGLLMIISIFTVRKYDNKSLVILKVVSVIIVISFICLILYISSLDFWLLTYGMPKLITLLSGLVLVLSVVYMIALLRHRKRKARLYLAAVGHIILVSFILNYHMFDLFSIL